MMDIWKERETVVLQLLINPLTRDEISIKMGLPRTVVFELLLRMKEKHLIQSRNEHNGKRTRPKVYWELVRVDE